MIVAEDLGKEYRRAGVGRVPLFRRLTHRRGTVDSFWALRHVGFVVKPGEMVGIIGSNGAGKSTLLRLLGGVGRPNEGRVEVNGRLGALLDLGGGFLPDLTGKENAVLAGVVAGLLRREIEALLPDIAEFAELEHCMEEPVRTYSTGMAMRLAFSVAVHTSPEVLLVDEFLSVGDLAFQAKCLRRIRELQESGCAIVLVSHQMDQIRKMCGHVLWLRMGEVAASGDAESVASAFEAEMNAETLRRTPKLPPRVLAEGVELRAGENRLGTFEVEIAEVKIVPRCMQKPGGSFEAEIHYRAKRPVDSAHFSLTITRDDGTICLDDNTALSKAIVPELNGAGVIRFHVPRLELKAGEYRVSVGVYEKSWQHAYDSHQYCYPFTIEGDLSRSGVIAPPTRWEAVVNEVSSSMAQAV